MGRNWSPPRSRKLESKWLAPGAYDALSVEEKRALWRERKAERTNGARRGVSPMPLAVGLVSMLGLYAGWTLTPSSVTAPAAPAGTAIRANFHACKWGGGTNCVVDGDTFYLNGEEVRIAGIDAPETHDYGCPEELALGERTATRLQELLNSGAISLSSIDRDEDTYGRKLRNALSNVC